MPDYETWYDRIYSEIKDAQTRVNKIQVLKISFVTSLIGFGNIKLNDSKLFVEIFFFTPFVSVFFDFLIMGEFFSIRRIGAFIYQYPQNDKEAKYESLVNENKDNFFKFGNYGFSILSLVVSIIYIKKNEAISSTTFLIIWVLIILALLFFNFLHSNRKLTINNGENI